jgi:hypothetical protein
MTDSPPQTVADLPASMQAHLRDKGVALEAPIVSIKGGGNNQVFRLTGASQDFVLKRYFQHPTDSRDRFSTERAFYELLWTGGLRQIPEPHCWDGEHRLGLFSFVNGRKINSEEITRATVGQAIQFIIQINSFRRAAANKSIPAASEAAFSVKEQIELIARRVTLAGQIESMSEVDAQASAFVRDNLMPAWQETAAAIVRRCESRPKLNPPLEPAQRCLSPSDFGFHNALLTDEGQLLFLDFEYAGWDDPAKLMCDFFCQPQLPVNFDFWDDVVNTIAAGVGGQESIPLRARLLLPAYQIKWCCIILNHFLKIGRARREFARGAKVEQAKAGQLAKARRLLQNLRRLQD